MKRYVIRMSFLWVGLLVVSSGCEKKKIPDHVIQQQKKETRKVERKKQLAQEVKKPREEDLWPAVVKEAYYRLFLSSDVQVIANAQALAQQGEQAVPALKFFLGKNSMKSKRKRALVSFMLVELHMFRPAELAKLARDWRQPIVQRAAIEALVRIGSDTSGKFLAVIEKEARGGDLDRAASAGGGAVGHDHGHGHGAEAKVEFGPLSAFIDRVRARDTWEFNDAQLEQLDQLLKARLESEVSGRLQEMRDGSLDQGLVHLLRSPVVLPATQQAVAEKLVAQNSKQVHKLCGPENPIILRVQAARGMIAGGSKSDLAFLKKLSEGKKDPFAQVVGRLLAEGAGGGEH